MDNKGIDRGYAFDLAFELQKLDHTPQVVDGTTAVWRLASSPDATEPLLEKADLSAASVGGKTLVVVTLTRAETETLSGNQYYHQLAVSLSGGEPYIQFAGWVQVQARL